jgi:large subunit ribosomal protein L24
MQRAIRGTTSRHPGDQRRALYRAPWHIRRKRMSLPLSRELRARYGRRRLPVRKGDTVRVLAGSFAGREERVARVDLTGYQVVLDNVTLRKADKKLKQLPISTGHLVITKLNLSDPWRRRVLKAPEEEAETTEPEEGEEEAEEEGAEGTEEKAAPAKASDATPAAAPAKAAPKARAKAGSEEE